MNYPSLSASKLHVVWCLKKFWQQIDRLLAHEGPQTDEEFFQWSQDKTNVFFDNFESLSESMKKLDIETDFVYFVKELTLNKKSSQMLNTQIRREILKKVTKFLKKEQGTQSGHKNEHIDKIINNDLHKIQSHLKQMDSVQKLMEKVGV